MAVGRAFSMNLESWDQLVEGLRNETQESQITSSFTWLRKSHLSRNTVS